ncbi:hypothetical protein CXF68_06115 [Tenacibaculum sp. Bg11-29]|uniref:VIT domain-containing protein n=1 Tax=Tenacibaculum sp. Bg11-29 TaxID=2058306 RepID=UPI000C33004C|nr:VIT domain-containing protein [Tenacibaculum sp. Bg11-29]PKH50298.1 hypothetical protein CXF68_06115 [Tenacibaculum sp. Bg11-29]
MKKLLLLFVLCTVTIGYSQKTPVLQAGEKQLALSSLDVKVVIVGNTATTTYDMLFYNSSSRILEGNLKFPLAENQEISRLALEMNGKLREAVVVDKELGRIAFEGIVRKGVDPALLEKGKGNTYNVRVYPIPAKGYKRVVIAYEQELLYKEKAHYYHLPLNFKNRLDKFTVFIEALNQNEKPIVVEGESVMAFSNWKNTYKTSLKKENYIPSKSILVKIPLLSGDEKVSVSPEYFYFYKTLTPAIKKRKKPKKITLYWDVSLSMIDRNVEKEIALLDAYFKNLGTIKVKFITFSNTVVKEEKYTVRKGNWELLKKELRQTIYDGGTSYKAIENVKETSDAILLFSDGITTLSKVSLRKQIPVFVVNSTTEVAHKDLFSIAKKTKGSYVNLNTTSIKEGLFNLTNVPFEYLGYTSSTKNIEVYHTVSSKGLLDFSVAGKNFIPGEKIIFFFGYGDNITKKVSVILKPNTEGSDERLRRIWAKNKLSELLEKKEEKKKQIIDLATSYSLVTDYTSLIVLEDVQDYIKYNITPPEELLEEYNRIKNGVVKKNTKVVFSNSSNLLEEKSALMPPSGPTPVPERIEIVEDAKEVEETVIESTESDESEIIEVEEVIENFSEEPIRRSRNEVNSNISQAETPRSSRKNTSFTKYTGSLIVKDRTPKEVYLNALDFFKDEKLAYLFYIKQRESYKKVPHYYIDVADYFYRKYNSKEYAKRILSNVAELDADSYQLLRAFAYKLEERKEYDLALFVYKRILELRPEDAQSYRDVALAYQNIGLCQEAFDLFLDIVNNKIYENNSHRRVFKGLQDIAEEEIKLLYKKHKNDLDKKKLPKEYILSEEIEPIDFRVIVDWNHNDTDIDLHIIDPNLEECYYSHPKTRQGGRISKDMTQGFGPEQFVLKKAKKGLYYVKIKYFGDRKQKIETPTFMKVTIFKNQGRRNEEKIVQVIRLVKGDKEEVIAKIEF